MFTSVKSTPSFDKACEQVLLHHFFLFRFVIIMHDNALYLRDGTLQLYKYVCKMVLSFTNPFTSNDSILVTLVFLTVEGFTAVRVFYVLKFSVFNYNVSFYKKCSH